jgi:hypothetical protein
VAIMAGKNTQNGNGNKADENERPKNVESMILTGSEADIKALQSKESITKDPAMLAILNQLEEEAKKKAELEKKKQEQEKQAAPSQSKYDGKDETRENLKVLGLDGKNADGLDPTLSNEEGAKGHKNHDSKGIDPKVLEGLKGAKDVGHAKGVEKPSKNPEGVKPPEKASMPRSPGGGKSL